MPASTASTSSGGHGSSTIRKPSLSKLSRSSALKTPPRFVATDIAGGASLPARRTLSSIEPGEISLAQLERRGANVLLEVVDRRCAWDREHRGGSLQEP